MALQDHVESGKLDPTSVPGKFRSNNPTMKDITISENGILKLLTDLNPSKAAGPDELKPLVLKRLGKVISPIIQVIFQRSLDTAVMSLQDAAVLQADLNTLELWEKKWDMEFNPDRVTKSLLKTRSGEFDLESIHSVNLKDLGLSSLGCIGECLGLERLDLSFNDVSKLHPLAGLVSLQYINLAANRISSLEGLQTLENLQTLNLAGNLIGGIGQLTCVSGLEKLTSLRLKDRTRGLSNPVCMNRDYHVEVKQLLPRLVTLDGERVNGRGSDVYSLFHEIDKALADRTELSENNRCTETVPWVPLDYWEPSTKFERSILGDAEQQLQGLLSSCMSITTKAGDILQELKSASSNGSNS